jgi:hypothetical protein
MDVDERNADLLNNTLNISPIAESKTVTPTSATPASHKKPIEILKEKEKTEKFSSPVSRTQKMLGRAFVMSPSTSSNKRPDVNSPSAKSAIMSGRGAQLINLSRNIKNESTPKAIAPLTQAKCSPKTDATDKSMANGVACNSPKPDPFKHKEYLTFSKKLPSPLASPKESILKRRFELDHDDFESPVQKVILYRINTYSISIDNFYLYQPQKKRVSFNDPPVSTCKEYIVHDEERRISKNTLTRKSKVDSMSELAKFNGTEERTESESPDLDLEGEKDGSESPDRESNTTNEMSALQVTAESVKDTSVAQVELHDGQEIQLTPPEPTEYALKFQNEEEMFKYISEKYTNASIIESIQKCSGRPIVDSSTANLITKNLSCLMASDNKTRQTVLDQLSEKHSNEFLDHALCENSRKGVCDRLGVPTMVEYIFQKIRNSKTGDELQAILDGIKDVCNGGSNKDLTEKIALFALQSQTPDTFYSLMEKYFRR